MCEQFYICNVFAECNGIYERQTRNSVRIYLNHLFSVLIEVKMSPFHSFLEYFSRTHRVVIVLYNTKMLESI